MIKDADRKTLWGRSGNICNIPTCETELALEKRGNKVMGEEAHIKGDKPTAPRYDPCQSPEERDSYENHILVCPTHHTEIDADPDTWTVERLRETKANHEGQVALNRRFPHLLNDLTGLLEQYKPPHQQLHFDVPHIIENPTEVRVLRVYASKAEGINTNIRVLPGQKMAFFARGLISYDKGHNFTTPEGIVCNEYGMPTVAKDPDGNDSFIVLPNKQAYMTDGGQLGRVGSLIGWINSPTPERAFLIGSRKEIQVTEEGILYLAINDVKGAYHDNDGEFRVDIRIVQKDS